MVDLTGLNPMPVYQLRREHPLLAGNRQQVEYGPLLMR